MKNVELIKALRHCGRDDVISESCLPCNYYGRKPYCEGALLNDAADAIEAMSCKVEEYKAAYRKEYNKRIAENRYLYDELTKSERAKLLMTPMRIEVPQPTKEE